MFLVEPAAQHYKIEKLQSCPIQFLPHWLGKQKVGGDRGLSEAGKTRHSMLQAMSSSLSPASYGMCLSSSNTVLSLRHYPCPSISLLSRHGPCFSPSL